MSEKAKVENNEALFDSVLRIFLGCIAVPCGVILLLVGMTENFMKNDFISNIFWGAVVSAIGFSSWFPTTIGLRVKNLLKYCLRPIASAGSSFASMWKRYNVSALFPENVVSGLFGIAFGTLYILLLLNVDMSPWLQVGSAVLGIGFIGNGFYQFVPTFCEWVIGIGLTLLLVGLIIACAVWAFTVFGAVACSIVIGSIIIASAIAKRN